jgi:hypothetical protein
MSAALNRLVDSHKSLDRLRYEVDDLKQPQPKYSRIWSLVQSPECKNLRPLEDGETLMSLPELQLRLMEILEKKIVADTVDDRSMNRRQVRCSMLLRSSIDDPAPGGLVCIGPGRVHL